MSDEPQLPATELINEEPVEESPIPEKYRDRLAEMEKLINQVEEGQKLYREQTEEILKEQFPQAKTGKPYKREDIEELLEQTAASYSQANYWITIVTIGVCLMVLPGFIGYLLDQQFKLTFWGPVGILAGMFAGVFYLIRAGEKQKSRQLPRK